MSESSSAMHCPLVVDLDGTLVATDTLWESAMLLARRSPRQALMMPVWLLSGGRTNLKRRIAEHVTPNAATLPYRGDVVEFLRQQKQAGRKIVLATAAHERIAQAVAQHLGLFDAVIATDATTNLRGAEKLRRIQQEVCSNGGGFDYVGDSSHDVPLWREAKGAYCVGRGRDLLRRSCPERSPAGEFSPATSLLIPLIIALRPRQWVKNILILLPLILAHKVADFTKLQHTLIAFLAFCLCASSIYLINDLLDIESDREHPRKRLRPFAAGTLPIPAGLIMCASLLLVAFALTALVNLNFFLALALYLALTTAYSFYIKGKLLLDVILLAGLYTHRIIAGAVAAEVELSPWLLAFSMFFFISLAFAKRYSELTTLQLSSGQTASGRSYRIDDLEIILSVGPTSGYLSVVVLCQYISDGIANKLYKHPQFLWLICPILLYWITRIWFFARRHALVDDPVVFAIRDRVSWMAAGLTGVLMVLAVL